LRRFEDFKCWSELEDVTSTGEETKKELAKFKANNENAL
jgi:hypothetical protein